MTLRVVGIDPGLTRCGIGVVDVEPSRAARLVHVSVVRSTPDLALERRLLAIGDGIEAALDAYRPQVLAIERVFAQHNLRTVMGVAQISGVALRAAAQRGMPVALHTPSEVNAAITGYGSAGKKQVQSMVARILGLDEAPQPADAADALALAICHAWRGVAVDAPTDRGQDADNAQLTPAQRAWRAAEKNSQSVSAARSRLSK